MNDGYVKFHRKSLKSSVWKNSVFWMVWSWCLLKASHETHKIPFNGVDIEIKRGQFITGRKKATKEIPISVQSYRTSINYLKSTGRITTKVTNRFTIITVVKYNQYQDKPSKPTNQSTSKLTNHQPATNQPLTTYKNDKNDKNVKKKIILHSDPSSQNLNPILDLFKHINPSYKQFFKNTTQRAALDRVIKSIGYQKTENALKILAQTNGMKYAPVIITPLQLESKLAQLIAFVKREKLSNKVAIIR